MDGEQQARRVPTRGLARVVMAAVLVAAGVGVWMAGSQAASSTELTLQYTCTLSPFPSQPMTAQLTWKAPDSVIVGQATPSTITVGATVTLGATITGALGVDGAATVQGSVDAPGTVVAPEGTIPSALQLTVPTTGVPASGPMTVHATGTPPSLVFHRPGHATVNAGSDLTLHLSLLDSAGNPAPVSTVDPSCTLDPGQNTVVFSFDIVPVPTAQPATAPATTGAVPAPTVTGPQPAVTPSGPTSLTSSPTASITTSTPAAQPAVTTETPPLTTPVRASSRAADPWRAVVGWWLAPAVILAAVAGVIGGVRWHARRRRRASRH